MGNTLQINVFPWISHFRILCVVQFLFEMSYPTFLACYFSEVFWSVYLLLCFGFGLPAKSSICCILPKNKLTFVVMECSLPSRYNGQNLRIWMTPSLGFVCLMSSVCFLGIIAHLLLRLVSVLRTFVAEVVFMSSYSSLKPKWFLICCKTSESL